MKGTSHRCASAIGDQFFGRRLGKQLLSRSAHPKGMTPNGFDEDLIEELPDCGKTRPAQLEGHPTPSRKCMFLFRP